MANTQAAVWMIGAIISFTSMAIAGRAVSGLLDTFEIMLYRSIIGFFVVLILARFLGTYREISLKDIKLHVFRNIFHFVGQNLWFFALPLIPLAQLFALEFTSPLWVIIIASLVLGEKLTGKKIFLAVVGFLGVLIIARPDFSAINVGVLSGATSAIGFAATAILTRKLTLQNSLTNILFYLTSLQIIFALICAGIDGEITSLSTSTLPWLALIGLTGLSAHFCLTKSLSLASASIVMPIDFARLPLIAVIGTIYYEEVVDIYIVLGSTLIFVSNYMNIKQKA